MRAQAFFCNERGAAATEMALLVPLLLTLIFGGFEAGHFVWTQHKLAEAVRDGARFAARLPIDELCNKDVSNISDDAKDQIILLTRTGQLSDPDSRPKVPGWPVSKVEVELDCKPDMTLSTGIYADLGSDSDGNPLRGPIVGVTANKVAYPSVLHGLGFDFLAGIELSATSYAPVIGL